MYDLKYRRQARNYLSRLPLRAKTSIVNDESDLRAIREAKSEPLYDREEAEDYIFMNPVKRERLERGWTQEELAHRIGAKQSTIAKWEREGAAYRKATVQKLAKAFGLSGTVFS